jgi:hypothetical protein
MYIYISSLFFIVIGMGGYDQFAALHQHYHRCNAKTQAILLTCYIKLLNLYPDTKDVILDVFTKYSTSSHLELQQVIFFDLYGSALLSSISHLFFYYYCLFLYFFGWSLWKRTEIRIFNFSYYLFLRKETSSL